ncbi:hypothetical protein DL766_003133 [Monosporascus sp. MC13-8B]|uniref:Threonine/serine exporter-like N-terminal domain-containing protein n=1 Tax=Monosporascus cannonballus TaxID=155416 RepID=A0ABY0H0L7_9PEZI|nr:hypothetical protein DL762_007307 [Monosporascus cannonballus]RYP34145.1 hypothetical protein DL766_003133 [Monosporascus sp. MC13-8B]
MEEQADAGRPTPEATSTASSVETSQNPTPQPSDHAARKEKGRVRFNSTAAQRPASLASAPSTPSGTERATPRPPRPSVLRGNSYNSIMTDGEEEVEDPNSEKAKQAFAAQARAQQVAASLFGGSFSAPGSRRNSTESDVETINSGGGFLDQAPPNIPLRDLTLTHPEGTQNGDGGAQVSSSEEKRALKKEAYHLVRTHTHRGHQLAYAPLNHHEQSYPTTRPGTPVDEKGFAEVYVPPPTQYRGGVLSNLLKLYKPPESDSTTPTPEHGKSGGISGFSTPVSSGAVTPTRRRWYDQNKSQDTLANLVEASARLGSFAATSGARPSVVSPQDSGTPPDSQGRPKRPKYKRTHSNRFMNFGRPRMEDEIKITIHIAETLSRQKYIIKLCRALMLFGAPTHRLEEYLQMTARVLEIDGQFLYLPGCMIISFDDRSTHTTEVKIVRSAQGIELGKLKDVHEIYKEVLHDVISVDEATDRLSKVMESKDKYHRWLRVMVFGLASATVAPFGFEGRLIDMPMCFLLGCFVGWLQLIVAPASTVYNNVFEVTATIVTSFAARALGSIRGGGLFCFSAMAQSSIALILPGWLVLCAALELQSKALVPGSIRMVFAIIYSLFLGFGITAKWKQMPVQVVIAFAGYVVNFFTGRRFAEAPQIANTMGALTVGILANLYSRVRHGVAAAALLPAIFVQVPSGLAATGSLLSGLQTANKVINATQQVNSAAVVTPSSDPVDLSGVDTMVYSVAGSMIQIAIGITEFSFVPESSENTEAPDAVVRPFPAETGDSVFRDIVPPKGWISRLNYHHPRLSSSTLYIDKAKVIAGGGAASRRSNGLLHPAKQKLNSSTAGGTRLEAALLSEGPGSKMHGREISISCRCVLRLAISL